jgi:S-adenosylmethionine/arginine decarboxylase-like enzyme
MDGLHILADLSACQCDSRLMTDEKALQALCEQAVSAAKLHSLGALFHSYSNQDTVDGAQESGATGILLLAESHLAVHTWPELKAVTLDIYACNYGQDNSAKVEHLLNLLAEAFKPADRSLQRGVTRVQRGVAAAFK